MIAGGLPQYLAPNVRFYYFNLMLPPHSMVFSSGAPPTADPETRLCLIWEVILGVGRKTQGCFNERVTL